MSWKNLFYFQKRDKNAIVALLILIVISGTVYIITKPKIEKEQPEKAKSIDKPNHIVSNNKKADREKHYPQQENKQQTAPYPYQAKLKTGETIELNGADTTALKKIPGIGASYANRIIKYRNILGGYAQISQLKEVWGLDEDLYVKIKSYITLNNNTVKIKVNSAAFEQLNKHPYINYKQAKIIVDIRERKGLIESLNRLALLDEFSNSDIQRLSPYLSFD